ncbi:hexose phosphate transport isoform A [Chlorella sorokiniana]|uniref:Hexose phosphate transport isoform A n=1 Tax=Chlorella sorokiniana TaxID=3076 RepID=A0A2P6U4W2_CHLSO|nr:hexose phosphate transport isoform A [Chlorella sorokiniana]|eukprot:PRW61349.1 hexose phosphate transport isoform A [Chlorella sorokiniana]
MNAGTLSRALVRPAGSAWRTYIKSLERSPRATKSCTSVIAALAGDALAQYISNSGKERWDYDWARTARLAVFNAFMGVLGHEYYLRLDGKVMPHAPTSPPAIASKLVIDQFMFAPTCTLLFYFYKVVTEGRPSECVPEIQAKYADTMVAGWKLWIPAHVINFAFVPNRQRILYANVISIAGTYILSRAQAGDFSSSKAQQEGHHRSTEVVWDGVASGTIGSVMLQRCAALQPLAAPTKAGNAALRSRAAVPRPAPLAKGMGAPAPQLRRSRATVVPTAYQGEGKDAPAGENAAAAAGGAAAGVKSLSELPTYPGDFVRRRLITFVGIVLGYSCFYLTRNSLTYTAPVMVADPSLPIGMTEIGTMTSIFPIAYGFSKFVSGVLGSRTSPTMLLAGGLMATAVLNVAFGFSTSLVWFCTWWAMNGMLQGVGAPCCARILTSWFAAKERGTYWGMWNIAHNMGGFLAPILAGTAAKMYGWQWGMFAPGLVGIVMGLLILLGVRDSPEAIGYPPVEAREEKKGDDGKPAAQESLVSLLVNDCLKNPYVVGLALTYFFVYVVRQGVTSWFVFYLLQVKGVADAGAASLRVSGLELGGLFGSLLAGKLSDMLINNSKGGGGNVGKRVQVIIAYTLGIAAMLMAFAAVPASMGWLQWATVFMIGFFLYGPQMMIGLCGAELVRPESVGASQGFLGWVAYLGAANAGIPLSIIVKDYGWGAYFTALLAACAAAVVLLAPMINAKSYVQIKNERLAAEVKAA